MLVQCAQVCWGRGEDAWGTDQRLVFALYMHMCVWLCTHGISYYRPQHPIFLPFSSSIQWDPHSVSTPGLSCPAVHSCEKQRSAERDICSVRECPNNSWPFNHSGFGLCGICGVSQSVLATLVINSFISVVLFSVRSNYHNAACNNSVLSTSSWLLLENNIFLCVYREKHNVMCFLCPYFSLE